MKKILLIILVATTSLLQAQKVSDTIINGKKFLVYPYKMEVTIDDNKIFSVTEIPPVLDSLPTGEYVLLKRKKKKQFIMAQFYISEGKLNKSIRFFDSKKRLVEEENYLNGWKHGLRKTYDLQGKVRWQGEYNNGKLHGLLLCYNELGTLTDSGRFENGRKEGAWMEVNRFQGNKIQANYKHGLLHGKYTVYVSHYNKSNKSSTIDLSYLATYINGKLFGDVKIYSYSYTDQKNYLSCEFYTDDTLAFEINKDNSGYYAPKSFSKYYRHYYPNGKIRVESYSDTIVNIGYEDFHFFPDLFNENSTDIDRNVWVPFNYPFNVYFDNGLIKAKNYFIPVLNPEAGSLADIENQINSFDTLFFRSGNIDVLKEILSDTLGRKRFLYNAFDDQNKIVSKDYCIEDSLGYLKIYKKQVRIGDQWNMLSFESRLLLPKGYKYPKQDSLYLMSITNGGRGYTETYVCPQLPDLDFNRVKINNEVRADFEVLRYGNPLIFKKIFQQDQLKVVSFCSLDTTAKDEYEQTINVAGYRNDGDPASLSSVFVHADSLFIYFHGQPYTGDFTMLETKKGKAGIAFQNNKITLCDTSLINSVYESVWSQYTVSNGVITALRDKIKWRENQYENSITFVNHLADGDALFTSKTPDWGSGMIWEDKQKNKKTKLIKRKSIATYSKGRINGMCKAWQYKNGWYLSFQGNYKNGFLNDTAYYYYSDGKLSSKGYYSNSKEEGDFFDYYNNGVVSKKASYKNGTLHGIFITYTPEGDTMEIANYSDGKPHGLTEIYGSRAGGHFRYDDKIKQYLFSGTDLGKDITQTFMYNNGRLESFEFKDEFKVPRVKIKVDSLYCASSFFNGNGGIFFSENNIYSVNSWTQFILEGAVEIYYPNGRLYAKGKMTGVPSAEDHEYFKTKHVASDCYLFDWKSKKTGLWIYNNSQGHKMAEVFYERKFFLRGEDTLWVEGTYKDFYDNGRLKSEGLLIWESTKIECSSDLYEAEFHVRYTTYLSASGDTLIKNGTGKLTVYHVDGKLKNEVELINGEYNGWYKAYNAEGKLQQVGKYINGKKVGRWLSGDLTGINYLNEECFPTDEIKEEQQEKQKLYISIEEEFYENGVTTAYYSHHFKRSE